MKEGKRLIVPGLCSQLPRSRESATNRQREKERKKESSDGAKVPAILHASPSPEISHLACFPMSSQNTDSSPPVVLLFAFTTIP